MDHSKCASLPAQIAATSHAANLLKQCSPATIASTTGCSPVEQLQAKTFEQYDKQVLCAAMCCCNEHYTSTKDGCTQEAFKKADALARKGGMPSRYQPQVSFSMIPDQKGLPEPLLQDKGTGTWSATGVDRAGSHMNNKYPEGWNRRSPEGGDLRRPDIVVLKDPNKPPYGDNIEKVYDFKFPNDKNFDEATQEAYEEIAGKSDDMVLVFLCDDPQYKKARANKTCCDCTDKDDKRPEPQPVPSPAHQPQDQEDSVDMKDVGKTVTGVALIGLVAYGIFTLATGGTGGLALAGIAALLVVSGEETDDNTI